MHSKVQLLTFIKPTKREVGFRKFFPIQGILTGIGVAAAILHDIERQDLSQ